jgi:hypothetical protein
MIGEHPGREDGAADGQVDDFALDWGHGWEAKRHGEAQSRFPITKEARQPIGRRAKFREETPVTRQDEEPNFTLDTMMRRRKGKIQQKRLKKSMVFHQSSVKCFYFSLLII